jgi:hypothetical protein
MKYISLLLSFVGPVISKYVKVLFMTGVRKELEILLPAASEAVRVVSTKNISSEEKAKEAFNIIIQKVGPQQASIKDSLVKLAIELALQEMKNA